MKNVARPKRPRERTATPPTTAPAPEPAYVIDCRVACAREVVLTGLAASTAAEVPPEPEPPPPAPEGNLCGVLVAFAAWRHCCVCGSLVLYVNPQARTDGDFTCGICEGLREHLAERLRLPSLPDRAALHLRALFATGNDNAVALMGGG